MKADLSYLESYKNSGKLSLRQYNRVNILWLLNKVKNNMEIEGFLNVGRLTIWRTKRSFSNMV